MRDVVLFELQIHELSFVVEMALFFVELESLSHQPRNLTAVQFTSFRNFQLRVSEMNLAYYLALKKSHQAQTQFRT